MNAISDCLEIWHTEGGVKVHLGTKFGWNTINRQRVISYYSQKITQYVVTTIMQSRLVNNKTNTRHAY